MNGWVDKRDIYIVFMWRFRPECVFYIDYTTAGRVIMLTSGNFVGGNVREKYKDK